MHEIWTIGHGTNTFVDFEERIAPLSIATVIDVRSQPYSRHAPDFTKAGLEELCAEAGLSYRWLGPDLGGRPNDPSLLDAHGRPDGTAIVRSAEFQGGIEELVAVAAVSPTVVLCAELDPLGCHRSTLITPTLEAAGFAVIDILADGTTRLHQPELPL